MMILIEYYTQHYLDYISTKIILKKNRIYKYNICLSYSVYIET